MASQAEKYSVGMAGEHFVVAELLRRGVSASVTMGNAKRADVIAVNTDSTKVVIIEVKSSKNKEWLVGNTPPQPSSQPWIFVHIPADGSPPRYFVLTAKELHDVLSPGDAEYRRKFHAKHGVEFTGKGLCKIKMVEAQAFENTWKTILDQIA
ncbi:hypothetical protein PTW32_00760 [Dechloromonas agitata]|jgi:hypothetical protein|uniref:hypothetical protein n=1 Tax=Dechloromonas agitata TaxID=73030 RepID=UPI00237ED96D|nr:hypothetical protein [Dechloromonas agitata]MDD3443644.1 hypothetical protein [Sulfurimonas denitrificans]MDE1543930.1 hypothetical protein [Dechloromonas agitata]